MSDERFVGLATVYAAAKAEYDRACGEAEKSIAQREEQLRKVGEAVETLKSTVGRNIRVKNVVVRGELVRVEYTESGVRVTCEPITPGGER